MFWWELQQPSILIVFCSLILRFEMLKSHVINHLNKIPVDMVFHSLGRYIFLRKRIIKFFISLLCLTDMLSLVQEKFQRERWKLAYQRCKWAPGEEYKYQNPKRVFKWWRIKATENVRKQGNLRDWNMRKLNPIGKVEEVTKGIQQWR